MKNTMDPEIRREVIIATGLCLNPDCVAHDAIVAKIWKYKEEAEEKVYDLCSEALERDS